MDFYIDEKDKELGRARLSQVGEGASAGGAAGGARGGVGSAGEDVPMSKLFLKGPKKVGPEKMKKNDHVLTL